MLLNSMSAPGEPHPDADMARMQDKGADVRSPDTEGETVPTAPMTVWRDGVITRLRGTIMNRLDLRVLPQGSNATELRLEVPLADVFRDDGSLIRPELVQKLQAAAGADSDVAWSVQTPYELTSKVGAFMATLSRMTRTPVAWQEGEGRILQVQIRPGIRSTPDMGTAVQNVGEEAGGRVIGVDGAVQ